MNKIEQYKRQMETAGFRLMATTKFPLGIRMEAHDLGHSRLVKGEVRPSPEEALVSLMRGCGIV